MGDPHETLEKYGAGEGNRTLLLSRPKASCEVKDTAWIALFYIRFNPLETDAVRCNAQEHTLFPIGLAARVMGWQMGCQTSEK